MTSDEQAEIYDLFLQSKYQLPSHFTVNPTSQPCRVLPFSSTVADYSQLSRLAFGGYVAELFGRNRHEFSELMQTAAWARASGEQYELEQRCEAGRIDVLMHRLGLIVEAKYAHSWKHALGQVLAYKFCLGRHYSAALLLLGSADKLDLRLVEDCCKSYDVHVFWHDYGQPGSLDSVRQSLLEYRNLSKHKADYELDTKAEAGRDHQARQSRLQQLG